MEEWRNWYPVHTHIWSIKIHGFHEIFMNPFNHQEEMSSEQVFYQSMKDQLFKKWYVDVRKQKLKEIKHMKLSHLKCFWVP